jgi:hypothetical protein
VAFTAASLMAAGAIAAVSVHDRRTWLIAGFNLAAGAIAAMVIVFFAVGAGTLFPIGIAIGAIVVGISSVAGALAGAAVRYAGSRAPRA